MSPWPMKKAVSGQSPFKDYKISGVKPLFSLTYLLRPLALVFPLINPFVGEKVILCLALLASIAYVYRHGSTDALPFATMGSGSLATMSVFESKFKEGLTRDEGISLVDEAICSGIFNDLGSGNNVDVCVITKGKTEYLRNYLLPNPRTYVSSKGNSFVNGHTGK
ncbi:hypothetical protein J5N97_009515 [Dioscorea zingiberensis]|uniref:Uncharacterized protein n=1 Tax=Dioscorea zingiberensis TaxID=325984 RepID=A0A9D5CWJ8_9LILI|nr:hypothetical protein J5N97_009515 [Dioscorea zingiberensis]